MFRGLTQFALCLAVLVSITVRAEDLHTCLEEQRAYFNAEIHIPGSSAQEREAAADQLRANLADQGLVIIDPDLATRALTRRQQQLIAMGDAVGALELARELQATLMVRAIVRASQRPIKGMADGLYNVSVQIDLKAQSALSGKDLATAYRRFRKAGLGVSEQLPALMERFLPQLSADFLEQICRESKKDAAPTVSPKEKPMPAAGATSELQPEEPIDAL